MPQSFPLSSFSSPPHTDKAPLHPSQKRGVGLHAVQVPVPQRAGLGGHKQKVLNQHKMDLESLHATGEALGGRLGAKVKPAAPPNGYGTSLV